MKNDEVHYQELEVEIKKLKTEIDTIRKEQSVIKKFLQWLFGKELNTVMADTKTDDYAQVQQLKAYQKQIATLEQEIDKFQKEKLAYRNQIEELEHSLNQSLPNAIYNNYMKLSKEIQEAISSILLGKDELTLFASMLKNYDDIWEYAKDLNNDGKNEDFTLLKSMLEQSFETASQLYNYEPQSISLGERFDSDVMSRDNKSQTQSGMVEEVTLRGYTKNSRIIKKSIVKVG